jgi:hypothetical protein
MACDSGRPHATMGFTSSGPRARPGGGAFGEGRGKAGGLGHLEHAAFMQASSPSSPFLPHLPPPAGRAGPAPRGSRQPGGVVRARGHRTAAAAPQLPPARGTARRGPRPVNDGDRVLGLPQHPVDRAARLGHAWLRLVPLPHAHPTLAAASNGSTTHTRGAAASCCLSASIAGDQRGTPPPPLLPSPPPPPPSCPPPPSPPPPPPPADTSSSEALCSTASTWPCSPSGRPRSSGMNTTSWATPRLLWHPAPAPGPPLAPSPRVHASAGCGTSGSSPWSASCCSRDGFMA